MEKINIALSAIEDNTVAIRELNKKLLARTACRVVMGKPSNDDSNTTTFGEVTSDGTVGIVVSILTTTASLTFGGVTLVTSKAPLIAVLPAGTGEVRISSIQQGSRALIIGG